MANTEAVNRFYSNQTLIRKPEKEALDSLRRKLNIFQSLKADATIDEYMESHPEYSDLQTSDLRHSSSNPVGSAKEEFDKRALEYASGRLATEIAGDSRYANVSSTRIIYVFGNPASAGGGEGGIEALDPDFRAGAVWAPIDTDQIAFSVYDAVTKGFLPGRRPGRGGYIINHPDRFATIRVMNHKGEPIFATSDFTLEQVTRPKRERLNPQITFDEVIARFGQERMKVYSFQGKLLDTANFDWMRQWDEYWEKFMRGEVLARNLWRAYVLYKAKIIGGYMVSTTTNETAAGPIVDFGFTMLVSDDENIPRLNMITTKDEDTLYEQYEGSRESFDKEMRELRFNSKDMDGYLQSINSRGPRYTNDPTESTVINEEKASKAVVSYKEGSTDA